MGVWGFGGLGVWGFGGLKPGLGVWGFGGLGVWGFGGLGVWGGRSTFKFRPPQGALLFVHWVPTWVLDALWKDGLRLTKLHKEEPRKFQEGRSTAACQFHRLPQAPPQNPAPSIKGRRDIMYISRAWVVWIAVRGGFKDTSKLRTMQAQ